MAEFDIYPKRVKNASTGFSSLTSSLYTIGTETNDHACNVMINDAAAAGIRNRLSKVATDLSDEYNSACNLSNALGNIVDKYDWTERNIIGVYSFKKYNGWQLGASPWENARNILHTDGKKFTDAIISAMGPVGRVVDYGLDLWAGDYDWDFKGLLKTAKVAVGLTKDIAGVVSNSQKYGFHWDMLLGATHDTARKTFVEALKSDMKGYVPSSATTVTDKVKVGCKWAGAALTVGLEGIENFSDPENTKTRAFFETIGEAAVKIGEAAVVGAAVGSVVPGAGTVVGAVAAAAGTIVVDWGLNAATNYLFGKDFDEAVSDAVLDTAEAIGKAAWDGAKSVANSVGNAVSSAKDTVCSWWSSTKNYFSFA